MLIAKKQIDEVITFTVSIHCLLLGNHGTTHSHCFVSPPVWRLLELGTKVECGLSGCLLKPFFYTKSCLNICFNKCLGWRDYFFKLPVLFIMFLLSHPSFSALSCFLSVHQSTIKTHVMGVLWDGNFKWTTFMEPVSACPRYHRHVEQQNQVHTWQKAEQWCLYDWETFSSGFLEEKKTAWRNVFRSFRWTRWSMAWRSSVVETTCWWSTLYSSTAVSGNLREVHLG